MDNLILVAEITSLVLALITLYWYRRSHSITRTTLFFLPLVLLGFFLERHAIQTGMFSYLGFNWFLDNVPVAVILYWFAGYYLYLLYKWFGTNPLGILKTLFVHFALELFIFTPIAIELGYWQFAHTLFPTYPYIPLVPNLVEVLIALLFVLLQFKIDEIYRKKSTYDQ